MYITKTISEIKLEFDKYKDYKLCYIDEIPETVYDMTPESKRFVTGWTEDDWKRWYENHYDKNAHVWIEDSRIEYKDYPNPMYIESSQTHYAYFTPMDLKNQWGDDWDDAPYEHNAGAPYDSDSVKVSLEEQKELINYSVSLSEKNPDGSAVRYKIIEYDILIIPFFTDSMIQPKDLWNYNSRVSVADINSGVLPWLFQMSHGKTCNGTCIYAGYNPQQFLNKLI